MSLQIQMLGTGDAFAKKRFNNNALVTTNHKTLLIDCGITAPMAFYTLGKRFDEIDGILVTHLHGDHIGGIEELAYQLYYKYMKRINLYVPKDLVQPLWENSLKGGLNNGEKGCSLHTYFDVVPLDENVATSIFEDLTIEIILTEHIPNKKSYSLLINDYLFYSSDLIFNKKLIEQMHFEKKCKYILHDCQLKNPGMVHTALDELLTLPDEIQEKIQLMHYDDNMEDFQGKTGKMTFIQQHQKYDYP